MWYKPEEKLPEKIEIAVIVKTSSGHYNMDFATYGLHYNYEETQKLYTDRDDERVVETLGFNISHGDVDSDYFEPEYKSDWGSRIEYWQYIDDIEVPDGIKLWTWYNDEECINNEN